jgi:predicted regulator of amino acid metabolism with ACT domain
MATTTIREFLVGLGFSVDEAGLSKFSSTIVKASGIALAMGTAVAAAAATVVGSIKSIAEEYDKLDKLATRFRSSADAVDEFNDIAGVLGLAPDAAIGGLTALDRAIGDTALGLGRAKKVFEEIGLQVLDAGGKMRPTVDVMNELGEKLKGMERGKAIAVMERLGLDPSLMKIFNADLAAMRADLAAIDKAAGFDLTEAVAQSKAFMTAWRGMQQAIAKVQLVFSKAYEAIAVKLMPRLRMVIIEVTRRIEEARKVIMENMLGVQNVIARVIDVVLRLFGFFWAIFGRVIDTVVGYISTVIGAFKQLDPNLQMAILTVIGLAAAWRFLNLAFLASPIGILLALGLGLLALYDDYMTWKEGGESLIDWGAWTEEVAIVTGVIDAFVSFLTNAFTLVFAAVDVVAKLLQGDFAGAWFAVGEAVNAVIGIFASAWDWITKIGDGIAGLAGKIGGAIGGFIGGRVGEAAGATADGAAGMAADPSGASAILGAGGGGGGAVTMNQNTVVQVQGGADPAATGRAVAGEQGRVNADMTRNARGAVR